MKKFILLTTTFFYLLATGYSQAGQPNPLFGNKGILNDASRQYGIFKGMSIQKGKIIVLDLGFYVDDYVRRYNLNGTPDSTFGINGKAFAGYNSNGRGATAIQEDEKIIVVRANSIARFNADGQPDNTFNGNAGARIIDSISKDVEMSSVAIQSDGKILAAGMVYSGGTYGFGIYRFNSDGSADKGFSGDGKQKTSFDSGYYASSIVLQPDGKIVVAGASHLVRYNTSGSLDNTFGFNGNVDINFDLYKIALQSDGKVIAAGTSAHGADPSDFVVARFNTNGSPDNTFNGNGKQYTKLDDDYGQDVSVAIQNDMKILVAGTVYHKGKQVIALARYNTNGSVDSVFGQNGFQETTGLQGKEYQCNEMIIYNNKAYVGGGFTPGIISYLLDEGKATRVQFSDPFYTQAFYTGPANINMVVKIINPAPGTTITKVDFYKDNTLMYSDRTSPYNYTLKNVHNGEYTIMAKATNNKGAVTTSAVVPVEVLPNQPPYIYLNNAFYYGQLRVYYPLRLLAPATVTFSATAYDPDPSGSISSVDFYDGKKLIYSDSTSPNFFTWNNIPLGKHSLIAKAVDNTGLTTTYIYPSVFSVDTSIEPSVRITTPFNGQFFNGPLATVNISADAYAMYPGGAISKVEFYNGATLLNTDSTFPYNFTWNNVPTGSYVVSAKATNTQGVSTTSSAVRIFVVVGQSPSVKITSPARDTNFITPGPILLTAEASDPYSLIKSVAFYNDSTLLFTETKEPFSKLWEDVPAGSYHITAVATDAKGLSGTSAPVHITVLHNRPPVVNIISPANGATFTAPATIVLTADAIAHGVKLKSVEFYNGTTLIHTNENFPYSFTWNNVEAGTYNITAKATDTYGRTTTSSPVTVIVASPASPVVSRRPSDIDINSGIKEEPGIQLSPNPAKNNININIKTSLQNKRSTITVISASGVTMKTLQTSGSSQSIQLNVSSLAGGMYIIKMISGDKVMYKQFEKL